MFINLLSGQELKGYLLSCIQALSAKDPGRHPLMMFKALLLQSWYVLSDSALEKQLARDLLFRRSPNLITALIGFPKYH